MTRRLVLIGVAALMVVAMAACDTTPPTFTERTHVSFVVGSQIGTSDATDEDGYNDFTFEIPRRIHWTATDDTASCQVRYDVQQVYAGFEPELILEDDPRQSLDVVHSDYNGDFGGGSFEVAGWNVIAHDCAGHAQESANFYGSNVWQETGTNPRGTFDPVTISWTGTWTTQNGAWASGGQQRFTSAAGASVSFTKTFAAGQHVALVMAKGPGRGSADVYVDDVKRATIDTSAATNDNRRVVFDRKLSAGSHTIRVVNLATAGHPRIDIDAFLT